MACATELEMSIRILANFLWCLSGSPPVDRWFFDNSFLPCPGRRRTVELVKLSESNWCCTTFSLLQGHTGNYTTTEEPRRKRQDESKPNHVLLFTIINPMYPITVVSVQSIVEEQENCHIRLLLFQIIDLDQWSDKQNLCCCSKRAPFHADSIGYSSDQLGVLMLQFFVLSFERWIKISA